MINYVKFANFSFLTLFFSMIFYWIQVNFPILKRQSIGFILMALSNVLLLSFLILRWNESGHFPLSNIYEALMFLSWCFTIIHLILEKFTKNVLLSCISAPTAFFINAFATLSLPQELQKATPLVPALQSNWLMMHVTVMILSYAALISGSLLAIAFLFLTRSQKSISLASVPSKYPQKINFQFSNFNTNPNLNLSMILDNLSYRIIGVGFPLLTIGILSGAVWANEAWGSYWSWDPKETWALLTWLIFAIYLHTRITRGWEGRKPAFIAAFGFFIVWICFLGVNLIGEGLHSYGWFQST
uniref:Cytochrome c biogenesis protein CcsA n=1 Tax=Atractomorpha echinata TaxID=52677 RepID=A0A140GIV0_9CHLO|nr:ccsA [Atractomorpha echinata]